MIKTGLVKTGLQNEAKISELLISGSLAINTKNQFGVHIFSGSVIDDGIISGQLVKPKYNQEELLKSIDTTIVELIDILPPVTDPTIYVSTFNEATQSIVDLTSTVEDLTTAVLNLNGKVKELEIITQSLVVELDARNLTVAVAENQTQLVTTKVESTITDLQNSIQKATAESIQRVSLNARNTSLIQENTVLIQQLEAANTTISDRNNTINQLNISLANANAQTSTAQTALIKSNDAQTKKKKIICNELYNQGYLPQHIWNADEIYGEMMYEKDPRLVLGYMMWARNVVKYMKAKPQNTKWIYMMVKPWTEHMAYEVGTLPKDNWIGKLIHTVGKQYCYYVYDKQMSKRNKLSWQ
jgi:hypothetical protein